MGIGQDEERWLGGLLYLSAMVTFIYFIIGFSLVPAAMLHRVAIDREASSKKAAIGDVGPSVRQRPW